MKYVGADLHKKSITLCVVREVDRKIVVIQRLKLGCHEVSQLQSFFQSLGEFEITVEATMGYDWFAALAESYARRVVIAHAGKLRIIAESHHKSDRVDAYILAEYLAKGMIPAAWRATPRVRAHRSLIRRRCKLQSRITGLKNTMRGILTRYNADRTDLFTRLGWKEALATKLLEEERWLLEDLRDEWVATVQRCRRVEERIREFAKNASVREQEARAVLASFPGVGFVTTETILAELGDWLRFRSANAAVCFAGLNPGYRESDGVRKDLRISKAGSPYLRWVLIQLAHRVKRNSARWQRAFERLANKIGRKKATCAIARRLLLVIFAMLRDGKAYHLPAAA